MIKKFILITTTLLMLLLLTSCSKKYNMEDTYINGQDYQYTYAPPDGGMPRIAESGNGYYFLSGYYLYYADKSTMDPVILCNKPNCLHQEETDQEKVANCNAFYMGNEFVSYFDDSVYILDKKPEEHNIRSSRLIQLSKDGTKRKSVVKFEYPPMSLAIHRGKVYASTTVYKSDETSVYGINSYDLGKSITQKPVTIYEGIFQNGNIQDIKCYGNNVYFKEYGVDNQGNTKRIMRYDLVTGEVTIMFKENGNELPENYIFANDKIIHRSSVLAEETGEVISNKNIISNLDGTNEVETFKSGNYEKLYSDGQYLYLDDVKWSPFSKKREDQRLKVLDNSGNVIASLKPDMFSTSYSLISGSKEHLFLIDTMNDMYQIFYSNKDEFEHGKIEFYLMFEIESDKLTPGVITYFK